MMAIFLKKNHEFFWTFLFLWEINLSSSNPQIDEFAVKGFNTESKCLNGFHDCIEACNNLHVNLTGVKCSESEDCICLVII